jgi:predicted FMN-binding regulatory protein PaiB
MTTATGIGWKDKFADTDIEVLHQLIRDHLLGFLVTHIPHNGTVIINKAPVSDLQALYVPFYLDAEHRVFRGHFARASPQAKTLVHALSQQGSSS